MAAKYFIVRRTKNRNFIYLVDGSFMSSRHAYFSIYRKYASKSSAQRAAWRLRREEVFLAANDKRRTVGEFEVRRLPAWV